MRTAKLSVVLVVGTLVLLVFVGIGGARQLDRSAGHVNYHPAADAVNVGEDPLSAVRESVSYQDQDDMGCASASEDCVCDECGDDVCCCGPMWRFFGDYLYLRPRSAEVTYAVPFDGPVTPEGDVPVQVGRIGLVDPDYSSGFRVGFDRIISDCASLGVAYTQLDSDTLDTMTVEAPIVIRSMVIHPSTPNAATDWLSATADYRVDFKLADLDYRCVFSCSERHTLNYLIGARYACLEQDLQTTFTEIGTEYINTNIDFDGGGIRLGLEGERYALCSGWLVYGRATASFVAGDFRASYFQGNSFDPEIVNTTWKAGRLVSILDLELGIGWSTPGGRLRLTGGYMVNSWFNTVTTADFIGAVQRNDFTDLDDTLTFDGLVVRAEFCY